MNTTRHTFSVTHCDNYENTGNCKTLAAAQSLANKHGSQHIFIRSQERTTDTDTIYMIFVPYTGWSLVAADEDDFAERATPTNLAETTTVYSMDVARVEERAFKLFNEGYHVIAIGTELGIGSMEADAMVSAYRDRVALELGVSPKVRGMVIEGTFTETMYFLDEVTNVSYQSRTVDKPNTEFDVGNWNVVAEVPELAKYNGYYINPLLKGEKS